MKKCKYCLAEIEDTATRCPACGMELEASAVEVPQEELKLEDQPVRRRSAKKKANPAKIAVAIALIVVLLAVLVALVMVGMQVEAEPVETVATVPVEEVSSATTPADGEPGTVTEKGSYTASDEDVINNRETVVAMVGDKPLTNGQLQVYFWRNYYDFITANYTYAQYFGLDMTKPLDTQIMDPTLHGKNIAMTWQQYFLQFALDSWHQMQAMALEAEEAGLEMADAYQEELDGIEDSINAAIAEYNITLEDYLAMNFGPGATLEDYKYQQELYYQGAPYYAEKLDEMEPTDQEVAAYFAEHEEEYASGGITKDTRLVDVRHILLQPENPNEDGTYSDEAWAACETAAKDLLKEFYKGEKTEEAFAELAKEHSTDPGSKDNGGLYEDVYEGQMVDTFNDWCFNKGRWSGDTGLVKTDYGYHVMYFVESNDEVWKDYASADMVNEKSHALLEEAMGKYEMHVFYDKINLGMLMAQQ